MINPASVNYLPRKVKRYLVRCVVNRAWKISIKDATDGELCFTRVSQQNIYPERIIENTIDPPEEWWENNGWKEGSLHQFVFWKGHLVDIIYGK